MKPRLKQAPRASSGRDRRGAGACLVEGMKELDPRVFVVNNEQQVRISLADLLAREAYTVEIFASATDYLERVPHAGPACLVLEVQLPGFDGLALQRRKGEWSGSSLLLGTTTCGWESRR